MYTLIIDVEAKDAGKVRTAICQYASVRKISKPIMYGPNSRFAYLEIVSTLNAMEWEALFETAKYSKPIIGITEKE